MISRLGVGRRTAGDIELARLLGVRGRELRKAIGRGWERTPAPSRNGNCFLVGDPLQVMLFVGRGKVEVSVPTVVWEGPADPNLKQLGGPVVLPLDPLDLLALSCAVAECAEVARETIMWCDRCYRPNGSYHMSRRGLCQSCGSRYYNIRY